MTISAKNLPERTIKFLLIWMVTAVLYATYVTVQGDAPATPVTDVIEACLLGAFGGAVLWLVKLE